MRHYRQPLNLYVPAPRVEVIDVVRAVVDLIQHCLIPAHGTLCRGDERGDWPPLAAWLPNNRWPPLALHCVGPEHSKGHGLSICQGSKPHIIAYGSQT
jgi:hypothetical protein